MSQTATLVVGGLVLYVLLQQKPAQVVQPQPSTTSTTSSKPTATDLARDAIDLLKDLYDTFKAE